MNLHYNHQDYKQTEFSTIVNRSHIAMNILFEDWSSEDMTGNKWCVKRWEKKKLSQFNLNSIKLQDSCPRWFIASIFKYSPIEKKVFWYKTISRAQRCIIILQVNSKSKLFLPRRWILVRDYLYYWMGLGENLAWPWSCRSPSDFWNICHLCFWF